MISSWARWSSARRSKGRASAAEHREVRRAGTRDDGVHGFSAGSLGLAGVGDGLGGAGHFVVVSRRGGFLMALRRDGSSTAAVPGRTAMVTGSGPTSAGRWDARSMTSSRGRPAGQAGVTRGCRPATGARRRTSCRPAGTRKSADRLNWVRGARLDAVLARAGGHEDQRRRSPRPNSTRNMCAPPMAGSHWTPPGSADEGDSATTPHGYRRSGGKLGGALLAETASPERAQISRSRARSAEILTVTVIAIPTVTPASTDLGGVGGAVLAAQHERQSEPHHPAEQRVEHGRTLPVEPCGHHPRGVRRGAPRQRRGAELSTGAAAAGRSRARSGSPRRRRLPRSRRPLACLRRRGRRGASGRR